MHFVRCTCMAWEYPFAISSRLLFNPQHNKNKLWFSNVRRCHENQFKIRFHAEFVFFSCDLTRRNRLYSLLKNTRIGSTSEWKWKKAYFQSDKRNSIFSEMICLIFNIQSRKIYEHSIDFKSIQNYWNVIFMKIAFAFYTHKKRRIFKLLFDKLNKTIFIKMKLD